MVSENSGGIWNIILARKVFRKQTHTLTHLPGTMNPGVDETL